MIYIFYAENVTSFTKCMSQKNTVEINENSI